MTGFPVLSNGTGNITAYSPVQFISAYGDAGRHFMETLTLELVFMLFVLGMAGGFVDSIAGGGGLISLPALMAMGLTPLQSLATNKAQAVFGSFAASMTYARRGHVLPGKMKLAIALTFTGSAAGTMTAQVIESDIMTQVMPFMLIAAALYFMFGPRTSDVECHNILSSTPFYLIFGPALGFYDGFFGPGAGSLWAVMFVAVMGFSTLKATAHTKIVNFTSNFASLLFFAVAGHVVWGYALVMATGQLVGARLGALMAITHGARLIRPLLVVVSMAMTVKIIYGDPGNIIHRIVAGLF